MLWWVDVGAEGLGVKRENIFPYPFISLLSANESPWTCTNSSVLKSRDGHLSYCDSTQDMKTLGIFFLMTHVNWSHGHHGFGPDLSQEH